MAVLRQARHNSKERAGRHFSQPHTFLSCSGLDVVGLLSAVPYVGEKLASTGELGSGATTFVVAYAVHKAFAPVRISITLACAPLIVRYLRRKGILKVKK